MVMNVTCASVKALDARLSRHVSTALQPSPIPFNMLVHLQPCSYVYIATGHLGRSEENVPAKSPRAIYSHRILATVRYRRVERHLAALVAIGRIRGPRSCIQTTFKVLSDLCPRSGQQRERKKGSLSQHDVFSNLKSRQQRVRKRKESKPFEYGSAEVLKYSRFFILLYLLPPPG
jgi:hypothetical protein